MEILEVPFPALNKGYILVRNHFSVVSTGTEGKTVTDARKGYIGKAKSRQKEVKQVLEMIKTNGLVPTYNLVMNKLEAPAALGYSAAGEVIAVGEGVTNFKVGDLVACGGVGASHADVISVPANLSVKVPPVVDLKQAAFSTIAAITIQGIRQADLKMGENCLIIGMGIIGQLTYKILEASGIDPIGIDISEKQVELCRNAGIQNVFNRNQEGLAEHIMNFSGGHGVDAILITAGTSSLDPVEFAGEMARKKGIVVIVGAVPTGFSRANYYKKELDLRMSSSYGPGRSDISYEEKGIDYPIAYVRWTENRNMQSFIRLLEKGRLNIAPLISHTLEFKNAPKAYDIILEKKEPFAGMVIQYDTNTELQENIVLSDFSHSQENVNVGFIGAGSFAQNYLLPNMKGQCDFVGVATGRGTTAKYVGDKYGFSYCSANADQIMTDKKVNTVFIATRHNLHSELVIEAIINKKHVFVEKPLAMNEDQLAQIKRAYEIEISKGNSKHIMVGFNRRFAPAVIESKTLFLPDQAKSISIRVNSGIVPLDHWINDPEIGGGRIIGEACHFIDLAMFLADSPIISVSADTMNDAKFLNSTVVINLKMKNGSIASVNYFANGNKVVAKEFIEVFSGGTIAQIDDFRKLIVSGNKSRKIKYKGQDKGHKTEVQTFLKAIKEGSSNPIPFEESYLSMLSTFKALQSIRENRKIIL